MKRLYKIVFFIFFMLLLGLILFELIFLRISRVKMNAPPQASAIPVLSSPDPAPTDTPALELLPAPSPEPTPEPTPAYGILLSGGDEIEWPCGIPFRDPGYTALDSTGEDLSAEVTITGEVTPWHTGDYALTYSLPSSTGIDPVLRIVHVVPQETKEAVRPEAGTICLTYIDTPCESTEELLKLLKRDEVKATFFVSTYQEEFLYLLTQIAEDGHELGIYLPDMSWYNGEEGVLEHCLSEIVRMQEIIYEKTGRYARFIRFYGGTPNAGYLAVRFPGGFPELYQTMHNMGLLVFDWNLEVDVAEVTAKISSNFTHPKKDYDYVVAMQQNFRRQSVLAVPEMIRWGKEKGYTFSVLEDNYPEVLFGQDEYIPATPEPAASASPQPAAASREDVDIASVESAIASIESEIASMLT